MFVPFEKTILVSLSKTTVKWSCQISEDYGLSWSQQKPVPEASAVAFTPASTLPVLKTSTLICLHPALTLHLPPQPPTCPADSAYRDRTLA